MLLLSTEVLTWHGMTWHGITWHEWPCVYLPTLCATPNPGLGLEPTLSQGELPTTPYLELYEMSMPHPTQNINSIQPMIGYHFALVCEPNILSKCQMVTLKKKLIFFFENSFEKKKHSGAVLHVTTQTN